MNRTSNAMKIIKEDMLAEIQPGISMTSYDIARGLHIDPKTVFIHMPGGTAEELLRQEAALGPEAPPITLPAPQFYVEFRPAAQCVRSHFDNKPETGEPWGPETLSVVGMFTIGQLYEIDRELGAPRDTHVIFTFVHERNLQNPGIEIKQKGMNPTIKIDEPYPMLNSLLMDLRDRSVYTNSYSQQDTDPELLRDITFRENRSPAPHLKVPFAQIVEGNRKTSLRVREFATFASAICGHLASPDTLIIQEPLTRQTRRWMIQKNQSPYWHIARPRTDG